MILYFLLYHLMIYFYGKKIIKKLNLLNHDYKCRKRRQEIETKTLLENGSFYMFKPKDIISENNRLHGNIGYIFMDKYKMFQIDEKDDLEIAEYFIKKYDL